MVIEKDKEQNPDAIYERLGVDILSVQLSSNLYEEYMNSEKEEFLDEKFMDFRNDIVDKFGYILPVIKVVENESLDGNNFSILVRGKNVCTEVLKVDFLSEVIVSLEKIVFEQVDKIIVRTDILKLLELVEYNDGGLTPEILSKVTVEDIREIYVRLLNKKISLRDVLLLFERLNYFTQSTKDISELVERLEKVL